MSVARGSRVSGLDVLRGYAAFCVIIFHVEVMVSTVPGGALRTVIESLGSAVPVFFALSAFSLLYGYSHRLFDERSMVRFYVRRVFRLMPLFYLMVALWAYASTYTARSQIVLDLSFLFPFVPGKHESTVGAGWSLGVEWMFYFAFPLFALVARRVWLSAAVFAGSILVALAFAAIEGYDITNNYRTMSVPHNLMFFQSGILAFSLVQHFALKPLPSESGRYVALGIIALTVAIVIANAGSPTRIYPPVLFAFVCGLWVTCAYIGLPGLIDNAVSRFLGRVSYGLYLGHPFMLHLLVSAGVYKVVAANISSPYYALAINVAITATVTIIFAAVVYRYVETPGIALGERLLTRAPPEPTVAARQW